MQNRLVVQKLLQSKIGGNNLWINENIEILSKTQIEKICKYHNLLVKFNGVMKKDILSEEQKSNAILNVPETGKKTFCELVDFLIFCFVWMILIINCIVCLLFL